MRNTHATHATEKRALVRRRSKRRRPVQRRKRGQARSETPEASAQQEPATAGQGATRGTRPAELNQADNGSKTNKSIMHVTLPPSGPEREQQCDEH